MSQEVTPCLQLHFLHEYTLFQTIYVNRYLTILGHFYLLNIYNLGSGQKRNHYLHIYLQFLFSYVPPFS